MPWSRQRLWSTNVWNGWKADIVLDTEGVRTHRQVTDL
jgi:hypothetical protein